MRTKSLVLAAVAVLGGFLSAQAQNVYSLNIVGYVNVVCSNQYTLASTPLNNANNSITNVLSSVPDGTEVWLFEGGLFSSYIRDLFGSGWDAAANTKNIPPGTGYFIKDGAAAGNFTVTYVGEVLTGSTTNALGNGYTVVGSKIPTAGYMGDLGYAGIDGDFAWKWKNGWVNYNRDLFGGGWSADPGNTDFDNVKGPFLKVGEGIFYNNQSGTQQNWIQTYTP